MKQVILGLGTGRCGTQSLTKLLSMQPNCSCTHERHPVPWDMHEKKGVMEIIRILLRDEHYVSDVGYYWLNYTWALVPFADIKFICLIRNFHDVVSSFERNFKSRNLFVKPDSEHYFKEDEQINDFPAFMPKYDLPKSEAIKKYCQEYYDTAKLYESTYPDNFKVFHMDALNSELGVLDMLYFAGFTRKDMNIQVGVKVDGEEETVSCSHDQN